MQIVLDVDDTLADFYGALEQRLGPAVDFSTENLEVMFPSAELAHYLKSDEFHQEMLPLEGAAQGVNWLLDSGNDLKYVTARAPELQQLTQDWLDQWGFPTAALYCIGRAAKKKLLRMDPYDLMIDDQQRYLQVAQESGKRTLAIERPWNTKWAGEKLNHWTNIGNALRG